MKSKNDQPKSALSVWGILFASFLFYLIYAIGCTQSKGTDTAMTPERQKAIEDSLRKEKEFDVAKNWSTAFEYYKNENFVDAKRYIWKVINLDPEMELANKFHYNDIHARLSNCYVQMNMPDSAQFALEEGLKFFPENPYLHESLGFMLRKRNQFDGAIEHYKRVSELEPEKSEIYKILGDLYRRTQQMDLAIEQYESYTKLEPNDRDAKDMLTGMYSATGRSADALASKEKMLTENPDDTDLMYELGLAYYDQGNYSKSISMFDRLLQKEPDNEDALRKVAEANLNLSNYNQAVNVYKKVLDLNKNDIEILCKISEVYRIQKRFTTARNWANRAISADRNNGLAYITRGEIYQDAASDCIDKKGSFKYDDRLVYKMAYDEFKKATRDPFYKGQAERQMKSIEPNLPTAEDKFMNTHTEPKEACYNWIK